MWLWHRNPEQVSEADLTDVWPGLHRLRIPETNLQATYGELTALPDYLPTIVALVGCPKDVLLSILQSIRAQSYYRLNALRFKDTKDDFEFAMFGPHDSPVGLVDKLFHSQAMDVLTDDARYPARYGTDRYTAQLARNACHFAPHAWYRWQAAHLMARDAALQARDPWFSDQRERRTNLAWRTTATPTTFCTTRSPRAT